LYYCRFRSISFFFPATSSRVFSRVGFLWRVSGGVSGAVVGGHCRSLLSLRVGEEVSFIAGCVRFVFPFACVVERDLLLCTAAVSMEAAVAASELLYSLSMMAALDSGFPCQRRSGSC
jgi:hypothetical protein